MMKKLFTLHDINHRYLQVVLKLLPVEQLIVELMLLQSDLIQQQVIQYLPQWAEKH